MKFKPDLKIFLATILMALVMLPVMAQERQVTGTVYEPDGVTPVFGATVVLRGTTTGTSTDARGAYSIRVTGSGAVLEIQFLGYVKQEIAVGERNVINVVLQEEAIEVSAVVVTALGLTREEKSLGYAVSKVASEEITPGGDEQLAERHVRQGCRAHIQQCEFRPDKLDACDPAWRRIPELWLQRGSLCR